MEPYVGAVELRARTRVQALKVEESALLSDTVSALLSSLLSFIELADLDNIDLVTIKS